MHVPTRPSIFDAAFVFPLLIILAFTGFFAQAPQKSPSPLPNASPSASPSPTPTRAPSPTPLPGAQNFHQWGSITVFNGLPSDSVRAIAQTPDGVMWFGTDNGLARFDGRRIQNFSLGENDADRVLALKTSPAGEILAGTHTGAFVYSGGSFQPVENTNGIAITAISLETEIYLGTDDGRVLRVHRGESGAYLAEKIFNEPIRGTDGNPLTITSLLEFDGKLLAGTSGRGAFVVSDGAITEFAALPRPIFVNSLAQNHDGSLWLGTDAAKGISGIFLADGAQATRIAAPTAKVLSLEANDSGVWAGTERYGLFHVADSKLKKTYTFENTSGGLRSNNIFTLFTDREGVLWIGTNRGVSRFDRSGASQETVSDIPNSNFIRCLFRAPDGTLYAGSNRGLFVKNGDKWNQLPAYGSQPIFAVSESSAKKLAVETEYIPRRSFVSGGANWIVRDGGLFREGDGHSERTIEAEEVRDVYAANDHVWAATTTRGLLHARRDERFGWLVSTIGFEQGLPSEKAFSILPTEDGLLIGTNRGVVTYKPATVAPKLIPTRILSQRVHDLGEIRSTIALDYPQNSLLVEVAGQSSRTFPEEFQYGFVLTDAKGKEIDRRISNDAQYAPADLTPGEYTIESIAFNRDLLASDPLAIHFSVAKAPFPWTATALGVLLAIAVLGLIWALIEHRRIQHRNRELAAARLDLANEAERERRRIARDLHDQTLADLRKLMMLTDKSTLDKPAFRTEIEAVSSEIRRICEDLSPSVLENVGLIASLEFLLDNTIEKRKFIAESDLEDRIKLPMNVQLQIYRIAQEVLTNIKSHSNADHVEMSVEINADGKLKLRIDDNGTPFHPDTVSSKGRGIANIKARASLVNAKVAWKELRAGGNRFAMSIED